LGRRHDYYFDQHPEYPEDSPRAGYGSPHGMEVAYVFQHLNLNNPQTSKADLAMSEAISTYWVNFAKRGDPNGEGLPCEDSLMIKTVEQVAQAIEQMGRMQKILESYRIEILPKNPRNFALLAAGPLEQLRQLQMQLEEYFHHLQSTDNETVGT
jgi:hypothetical protein